MLGMQWAGLFRSRLPWLVDGCLCLTSSLSVLYIDLNVLFAQGLSHPVNRASWWFPQPYHLFRPHLLKMRLCFGIPRAGLESSLSGHTIQPTVPFEEQRQQLWGCSLYQSRVYFTDLLTWATYFVPRVETGLYSSHSC